MNINGKIKKIILSYVDDESYDFKLIAVEREKGIKVYTRDLDSKYQALVAELVKTYPEEVSGLSKKDMPEKLEKIGKIVINNNYEYEPEKNKTIGNVKNLVFNKKVLAGAIIVAIAAGAYSFGKNAGTLKIKNDKNIETEDDMEQLEDVLLLDNLPLESSKITDVEGVNYIDITSNSYTSYDDSNLEQLIEDSQYGMSDIANYIKDEKDLDNTGRMICFENFVSDENEKAYIKYFSSLRNEIIFQTYRNGNLDVVPALVKNASIDVLDAILSNKTVQHGEFSMTYDDLSDEAKKIFLQIAISFTDCLNEFVEFGSQEYNSNEIGNLIVEQYNGLSKSK